MGYPRPQLRRDEWFSLDGTWDFAIEAEPTARGPNEVEWRSQILVPFSPETPKSGIGDTGLYRACWYRRTFPVPKLAPNERLLLHFGAVDYHATVWVNGARLGEHEGADRRPKLPIEIIFQVIAGAELESPGPPPIVIGAQDEPER